MKRSHKKLDPAFKALRQCVLAMEACPPRMRRPTLDFLWDKYVLRPPKEPPK